MQVDAGGRIGTGDLLKQLVRLRLPVTTDLKVAVRVLQQMDRPVLKTYRDTADLATL